MTDKILDNMNGQEIKELIDNQKILINELDASALSKLMDYETDMLCFGNGDIELIRECSDRLDSIRENGITDEAVYGGINKAKAICVDRVHLGNTRQIAKFRSKYFGLRKVGLVAAAIAVILTATTLIAAAFGVNIFEMNKYIARQTVGTGTDMEGITFINKGEEKKYSSLEELLQSENLDIMYPSKLPDGVEIKSIGISEGFVDNGHILMRTNNKGINFEIDVSVPEKNHTFKDGEIIKNNEMTFYVFYEQGYFAYSYHGGNAYSIRADSYENLILIIKSFKEQ